MSTADKNSDESKMADINFQATLSPPSRLELTGNLAVNWKRFQRAWKNYEIGSRLKELSLEMRTATLLTCIGPDALDILEGLDFEEESQRNNIDIVMEKLEEYCVGETNEIYERYCFNKRDQETNETVELYVTVLRKLAKTCNFGTLENSLIRDRLVVGIRDNNIRKRLLQVSKLTLKDAIDICRSYESTCLQLKAMSQEAEVHKVDKAKPGFERSLKRVGGEVSRKVTTCKFCGKSHPMNKLMCPAWGKTCNACGRKNHFALMCSVKPRERRESLKCVEDVDSDEYIACVELRKSVCAVEVNQNKDKVFATMLLNDRHIRFQLDSGATVNVISQNDYSEAYGKESLLSLETTNATLVMFNKSEEKPLGKKRVRVVNPKNGKKYSVEFVVVKGSCTSLLGAKASQQMGLLSVNRNNILAIETQSAEKVESITSLRHNAVMSKESMLGEFADVFAGEGKLEGELHLEIDPAVTPVQLPTRRVPLAVKEKLKTELSRLENLGVIKAVDVPTDWISAMVVTMKKDGRIRVCVDPKPLNRALKRNHYPLPTIEDVLPQLAKVKFFTVLDAKNGFWHVSLDEMSSYATTFGTPWGRYRWLRMPFGIAPAPEEFQRRIDQALVGLNGCSTIADDILVFGCGETSEEALEDHDLNLRNVLERCREKAIKLNGPKVQFRCEEVAYMGHTLTKDGLKQDASKVKAVEEMPPPSDKKGVQRLLGMTNYLQRYAPKLAEVTNPLRELTKKESDFIWEESVHGRALAETKRMLTTVPVLKYFDPTMTPVLQCDASMHGLGVCLMQDGQPVAYASRSLTDTEVNYAHIEKELLAIVYGMEKFETYVYGRKVLVESDHKPLETIFKKSLLSAPKRLQRMLLRLQR